MSQRTVELVIGRLLTDEELRLQFTERPFETMAELCQQGWELSRSEIEAFMQTDAHVWNSAADRIHPRLQRCSLRSK